MDSLFSNTESVPQGSIGQAAVIVGRGHNRHGTGHASHWCIYFLLAVPPVMMRGGKLPT